MCVHVCVVCVVCACVTVYICGCTAVHNDGDTKDSHVHVCLMQSLEMLDVPCIPMLMCEQFAMQLLKST